MSGGHFDYQQYRMHDIAVSIDRLIATNGNQNLDEYGDMIGRNYPDHIIARFKEASHTIKQAEDMAQRVDWLVSGDDSEESFMKRWDKEVRPYWIPKSNPTI